MYGRIVVALDGSARGERALDQAADLAKALGAPLHLVRIADMAWLRMGQSGASSRIAQLSEEMAEEQQQAEIYLQGLSSQLRASGLTVTSETRTGMAARELVALTTPDDLLVMSSHGRRGPVRWLLGSVAEEVVRQSQCPVLLVRAAE
ncbi:MAG: universal stress protein [Thermomicrobiales bacterium]